MKSLWVKRARYLRACRQDIGDSEMLMKTDLVMLLMVAGTCGGISSCLAEADAPSPPSGTKSAAGAPESPGPRIEFATQMFDFSKAVLVAPNQITLPAGPLAASLSRAITIRNNGTKSLALSDARLNIPGAEVRVQETQPGRLFKLTVNFPAGFQIKPDQKLEVTLKSNHPRFSLIKVPVFQPQPSAPSTATQLPSAPLRVGPTRPEPPGAAGKSEARPPVGNRP